MICLSSSALIRRESLRPAAMAVRCLAVAAISYNVSRTPSLFPRRLTSTTAPIVPATRVDDPISPYTRTAYCGHLSLAQHANQTVALTGWIESIRKLSPELTFLVLRDGTGKVQLVMRNRPDLVKLVDAQASLESIVAVKGKLVPRPDPSLGVAMAAAGETTAMQEVAVESVEVVNRAAKLPVHLFGPPDTLVRIFFLT